ncbi:MAG: CDP-diacylglycerol--glycerol-3-phosphate 3-phosphatidyltransferase [candidate division KSB1 bacterium]|nr:CDP-diacylglycerol--glycerol-3-phosphate 3-phosphatidyltransferase [candidate division KSB1 bacterium]
MSLPNQLTVLRIILTPVFVILLFMEHIYFKYVSFVVFLIATLTDWYDGYAARKFGYVTVWGKFLDPLADKILMSSAFISLNLLGYIKLWMVVVIVFRDFLITALRSYAMFKGQPIITSNLARWKTVSQMAAVYFILVYFLVEKSSIPPGELLFVKVIMNKINEVQFIDKLMLFVTFLTVATGVLYLVENRRHIKNMILAFYRVFIPSDLG